MDTISFWAESASIPRFTKLKQNDEVDVVVIGAGITGATAAYLLKRAGCTVALIERGRCGGVDSINTTAHLTCVTDTRLHKLVKLFGKGRAKAAWEAGRAAIDQIVTNIRNEGIGCEYGGNGITYSLIAAEIIRDDFLGSRNRDAHIFRFER